jgi:DNA-binding PadR family transcriptional regulator
MVKQHRERVGNRRARYYQLTVTGRKQLVVEVTQFERVMGAITRIIQTTRPWWQRREKKIGERSEVVLVSL